MFSHRVSSQLSLLVTLPVLFQAVIILPVILSWTSCALNKFPSVKQVTFSHSSVRNGTVSTRGSAKGTGIYSVVRGRIWSGEVPEPFGRPFVPLILPLSLMSNLSFCFSGTCCWSPPNSSSSGRPRAPAARRPRHGPGASLLLGWATSDGLQLDAWDLHEKRIASAPSMRRMQIIVQFLPLIRCKIPAAPLCPLGCYWTWTLWIYFQLFHCRECYFGLWSIMMLF